MSVDIKRLLADRGIEYQEFPAKNVARGNVNVRCPFCGPSDPSAHMGINLETGKWGCWRDSRHRGLTFARLLSHLLMVDQATAAGIISDYTAGMEESDLDRIVAPDDDTPRERPAVVDVKLPSEARVLGGGTRRLYQEHRFWSYLVARGFVGRHKHRVARRYDMHYALSGPYRYRIVLPVTLHGELKAWTSRSVFPDATLRYKSSSEEHGEMRGSIKDYVYNFDNANERGNTLFVCEGPFDAIKVDYWASEARVSHRAVALFNMVVSDAQLTLLTELADKYHEVVVLLDRGEVAPAMLIADALSAQTRTLVYTLQPNAKDPGAMTREKVHAMCLSRMRE